MNELIFSAFDAEGNDVTQHVRDIIEDARELCDQILGSPSETPIRGRIESLAFALGHRQFIMAVK